MAHDPFETLCCFRPNALDLPVVWADSWHTVCRYVTEQNRILHREYVYVTEPASISTRRSSHLLYTYTFTLYMYAAG